MTNFVSYGEFVEGQELLIAWVSFSKQEREYKKQLLYYLGIEPQNTLEMTRTWCLNSAPQNIMNSLFQYSINEVEQECKKLKEQRKVNKNFQEEKFILWTKKYNLVLEGEINAKDINSDQEQR